MAALGAYRHRQLQGVSAGNLSQAIVQVFAQESQGFILSIQLACVGIGISITPLQRPPDAYPCQTENGLEVYFISDPCKLLS